MNKIGDCKIIFVVCAYDGDESMKIIENVVKELIKDDKKNNRNEDVIYVNALKCFNWLEDILNEEELTNNKLILLSKCSELYVLPNYELDKECNQCIGLSKTLGIPITYL